MISRTLVWKPNYRVDIFSKMVDNKEVVFIRTTTYMKERGVGVDKARLMAALEGKPELGLE